MRALERRGLRCIPESARAIITEHGGRPPLPRFAALMLERDLAHFQAETGPALFDRTLVDAWATFRTEAGAQAMRAHRFNAVAFVAPPWRQIYVQDAQRDQTWAEAVASHELCVRAYDEAGYRLLELPRAAPDERAAFVMEAIGLHA